jgi:hypothetical protein
MQDLALGLPAKEREDARAFKKLGKLKAAKPTPERRKDLLV